MPRRRAKWRSAFPLLALVALSFCAAAAGSPGHVVRDALVLAQPSKVVGWVYTLHDGAACEVGDVLVVKNRADSPLQLQKAGIVSSLTVKSETKWSVVALPIGSDGVIVASFHLLPLALGRPLGALRHLSVPPSSWSRYWYAIVARLKLARPMHAMWQISGVEVWYRLSGHSHQAFLPEDVRVAAAKRCRD